MSVNLTYFHEPLANLRIDATYNPERSETRHLNRLESPIIARRSIGPLEWPEQPLNAPSCLRVTNQVKSFPVQEMRPCFLLHDPGRCQMRCLEPQIRSLSHKALHMQGLSFGVGPHFVGPRWELLYMASSDSYLLLDLPEDPARTRSSLVGSVLIHDAQLWKIGWARRKTCNELCFGLTMNS